MISASDNPSGVFSFLTASLALSEDGPASGQLEVQRMNSLSGEVVIAWEALYTDGQPHQVPLQDILLETRGTIIFRDNSATPDSNILLQLRDNGVRMNTTSTYIATTYIRHDK